VNALAGCVQLYRPLGYVATFGYLEHVAGPLRREEAALLRALDALTASRDIWLAELGGYADHRREAKRTGRRSPLKAEPNPSSPACWYGDPRRAAIFTLAFLLKMPYKIASADTDVVRLASNFLEAEGNLSATELEQLRALRQDFEQLRQVSGWPNVGWPSWRRANQSLWILHQISYAIGGGDSSAATRVREQHGRSA
jgi:hypothetical protein